MVLVRKLKQMEALEVQRLRESHDDGESTSNAPIIPEMDVVENHESTMIRKKRTPSPPRRPVTRSQTYGRPPPYRRRGDHAQDKRSVAKVEISLSRDAPSSASSLEPEVVPNRKDTTVTTQVPASQYTFLGASSPILERRGPRSRAAFPIPVPNLTKKSRGRGVPTKPTTDKDGTQKATRIYVCKVEDCGKCFNRGEHLKRHIRSIHTHEKPFKCQYPTCDKYFNRHDNLLQHLKVHKDFSITPNQPDPIPASSPVTTERSSPPRDIPTASYTPYYHSPSVYTTNMAISSLRTELPIPSPDSSSYTSSDTTGRSDYRHDDDDFSFSSLHTTRNNSLGRMQASTLGDPSLILSY